MIKVLIIGKKSFLGSNLKIFLSKIYDVDIYSFDELKKKNIIFFEKYTHIINCAIHPKYIKSKYDIKYDLDRVFIKKFYKINFYYIFFNTRKIYSPKENISEFSKIKPLDVYAQNKFITEKYLKNKIKSNLISLRISNIIGRRIFKNNRNHHKLFFDNFLEYKKNLKNKKLIVINDFKDFLSIDQFCLIVAMIIKFKVKGIFNVSISKKIYLSEITKWLDKKLYKKINFIKPSKNSFTLLNTKLIKKIKINLTKNELKTFCEKLI